MDAPGSAPAELDALLKRWEDVVSPGNEHDRALESLRDKLTLLTDVRHLAGIDSSPDLVQALEAVLARLSLVDEGYPTAQAARHEIATQNSKITEAKALADQLEESLADLREKLEDSEAKRRRLKAELSELRGLRDRYRTLGDERDRLEGQLDAIQVSGDEIRKQQAETVGRLHDAERRSAELEGALQSKSDELDEAKRRLERAVAQSSASAEELEYTKHELGQVTARLKQLEPQLRERERAVRTAKDLEQQRNRLKLELAETEEAGRTAVEKARAEGRREGAKGSVRRPAVLVVVTLLVSGLGWLIVRAVGGLADGSWVHAPLQASATANIFNSVHLWSTVLLATIATAAVLVALGYPADEVVAGCGIVGGIGALAVLGLGLLASSGLVRFTDAEAFPEARCLTEIGPTSVSRGWSCDLDVAVGERSPRLEVVAYTDEETTCRSEAAAYLGVDRAVLATTSPPLQVRLLPGLPGRARPCVVESSDADHVVGLFTQARTPPGTCFSSRFFDPTLPEVWSQVDCRQQPWRFQSVGALNAPDMRQARSSPMSNAAVCTQRFGEDFDLDVWHLVGRFDGESLHCAVAARDGTLSQDPAPQGDSDV